MKTIKRFGLWLAACFSFFVLAQLACSSDDPSPNGTGGSSAAGTGGSIVGGNAGTPNGGSSGSTDAGGNGGVSGSGGQAGAPNGWTKGVVGKATKGAVVLAKGAGQIQGFSITGGAKLMDLPFDDAGAGGSDPLDAGDEAGVDTSPQVSFAGINPDFVELWIPMPPYASMDVQPLTPLGIAIVKPDASKTILSYPDWMNELPFNGFIGTPITVNGNQLRAYDGVSYDSVDCLNRHFWITNIGNKVYELFPDGTKDTLADNLPTMSAIICHEGFLYATTLPQYSKDESIALPVKGVSLLKIPLDKSAPTVIVDLPVPDTYAKKAVETVVAGLPYNTDIYFTMAMSIPVALTAQGDFLVGDVGGRTTYVVKPDGQYEARADILPQTVAMATAPNEVTYVVEAPINGGFENNDPSIPLSGPTIKAFDGVSWQTVLSLPKYTSTNISSSGTRIPCPAELVGKADYCWMSWGIFVKISPGATPVLYVMDPVEGNFFGVPLELDADAGTGGSGGEGGSAGLGGQAGASGEAGSAGEAGSSGAAGEAPDASDN